MSSRRRRYGRTRNAVNNLYNQVVALVGGGDNFIFADSNNFAYADGNNFVFFNTS